jgi:recombinational DNA repair protein (RecF pathway)
MKMRKCPKCKKIVGLDRYGFFHRHIKSKGIVCSNSWGLGKTNRAQMKVLVEKLRFAQMHVRLDLNSLKRSKEEVSRVAKEMRKLQREKYDNR